MADTVGACVGERVGGKVWSELTLGLGVAAVAACRREIKAHTVPKRHDAHRPIEGANDLIAVAEPLLARTT
jgi:hypothetical protein